MNRFSIYDTPINGLKIIERQPISDERGYLERMYCFDTLSYLLKGKNIRQINHTLSNKMGTVRGLHFQYPPYAETKIVSCIKGQVWDLAVDLRKGSSTFLQYYAIELSEFNNRSFLIPEGFAHGFQTLTHDCELLYFHTSDYKADAEGALNALDPCLRIKWPGDVIEISDRDCRHANLNNAFEGIEI
jgi:dTDP-4-dehydrorhamnose 3,5-epimerase